MSVSLNFSLQEKNILKKVFLFFEELSTKNTYEERRWSVYDSKVTLYNTGKLVIQGRDEARVKEFVLEKFKEFTNNKDIIFLGIDETGRGENYGHFVVSGVLSYKDLMRELRDSKKISGLQKKKDMVMQKALSFAVFSFSPQFIDLLRRRGVTMDEIQCASQNAVFQAYKQLLPNGFSAVADGKKHKNSSKEILFLVKGDDLNPVVGAASVIAKHFREITPNKEKRRTWKKNDSRKR